MKKGVASIRVTPIIILEASVIASFPRIEKAWQIFSWVESFLMGVGGLPVFFDIF